MKYTAKDLAIAEQVVRELHGLQGYDAWAERIARAIAEGRAAANPEGKDLRDLAERLEELTRRHPEVCVAHPIVQSCADHLLAIARLHELQRQAAQGEQIKLSQYQG